MGKAGPCLEGRAVVALAVWGGVVVRCWGDSRAPQGQLLLVGTVAWAIACEVPVLCAPEHVAREELARTKDTVTVVVCRRSEYTHERRIWVGLGLWMLIVGQVGHGCTCVAQGCRLLVVCWACRTAGVGVTQGVLSSGGT